MTMRDFYRKVFLGGTSFAALFLSLAGGETAFAQTQAPAAVNAAPQPLRNYLRSNVVRLPIEFNNQLRGAIQEIQLYCKENQAAVWTLRGKVDPNAGAFNLRLQKDGEYAFTMVTVDKQGRAFPENVQQEPPGLIVVVDTLRPVVELTNLGQTADGILIKCEVHDPNLDLGKTHFSFQGGDKVFRQLVPTPGKVNLYCIPSDAVFTGLVRVYAQDLAGNHTVCEEHLNHMAKEQHTESPKAAPAAPAAPTPLVKSMPPGPVIENMAPEVQAAPPTPVEVVKAPMNPPEGGPHRPLPQGSTTQSPTRPSPVRPTVSEEPRLNDGPKVADGSRLNDPPVQQTNYRAPQKRQIVNSTKVFLDYQIENAAAVGKVEVWLTRDQGKIWQKHAEDTQRKSPVEVNLPGEGVFGVTLVVSNAAGVITPPAAGDAPDGWIEVDTAKPIAQITKIDTTHESGQHSVHIHWNVQDTNLSDTPVELLYAATTQGPWLSMAKGLKAEGQHAWTPPANIGARVHVRLIARDTAGNEAIINSLEPVTLTEPARPRAILRGISTGAPVVSVPSK